MAAARLGGSTSTPAAAASAGEEKPSAAAKATEGTSRLVADRRVRDEEKEARRRASRSALIKVCRSTTMTPPYLPPLSLLSPPSFLLPGISSLYYLTPFSSAPSLSRSPSLRLGVSLSSSFFLLPFLSCLYCAPRFTFHVSLGFVFFTQFRFECSCHSLPHSSGTFRHVSIHGD